MAVNVNSVYETVLYLLNKEQRGYITPEEFNKLATQVQLEIFEDYFSDANQLVRKDQLNAQNDSEFFNPVKDIEYKLYPFQKEVLFSYDNTNDIWTTTENVYKIGDIIANYTVDENPALNSIAELTTIKEYNLITRSKLTTPTKSYPLFYISNQTNSTTLDKTSSLKVFPKPDSLLCNILTTPSNVYWGYTIGSVGQFAYNNSLYSPSNPNGSINFELDISEQTNIILNILKYCGMIISDGNIIQAAMNEIQQNKANLKS